MDECKNLSATNPLRTAVAFFKHVFHFLHGVMAFQPLAYLFILFADEIFQTENVWALIGTNLLSLIITGLFNLLYLIVLLAMIRISYTMPTFK
jgi:branched-subunit amino acid transport protein